MLPRHHATGCFWSALKKDAADDFGPAARSRSSALTAGHRPLCGHPISHAAPCLGLLGAVPLRLMCLSDGPLAAPALRSVSGVGEPAECLLTEVRVVQHVVAHVLAGVVR